MGREKAFNEQQREVIYNMYIVTKSFRAVSKEFGLGINSVKRIVEEFECIKKNKIEAIIPDTPIITAKNIAPQNRNSVIKDKYLDLAISEIKKGLPVSTDENIGTWFDENGMPKRCLLTGRYYSQSKRENIINVLKSVDADKFNTLTENIRVYYRTALFGFEPDRYRFMFDEERQVAYENRVQNANESLDKLNEIGLELYKWFISLRGKQNEIEAIENVKFNKANLNKPYLER